MVTEHRALLGLKVNGTKQLLGSELTGINNGNGIVVPVHHQIDQHRVTKALTGGHMLRQ